MHVPGPYMNAECTVPRTIVDIVLNVRLPVVIVSVCTLDYAIVYIWWNDNIVPHRVR